MALHLDSSPQSAAAALYAHVVGASSAIKIEQVTSGELPAFLKEGAKPVTGFAEVIKAIAPESPLLGASDDERKETDKKLKTIVKEFLPSAAAKDGRLVGRVHKFNKDLQLTTFMTGNTLSAIDLLLYAAFQPLVASWDDNDRILFANVTRWFDWVQHQPGIAGNAYVPAVSINVNKNTAPAQKPKEAAAAKPKAAEAKDAKPAADGKAEVAPAAAAAEPAKQDAKAKPAQQPKQQSKQAPKAEAAKKDDEDSKPEDVSRLDIRIGKIVAVKKHESADTLYVEEIDLGEAKPRQVVSGLVNFVPIEEMRDRMVVVLCNLKPANLKGVRSEAMVLAASNQDHTQVELLTPPEGAKIGERVFFDEFPGEPDAQLNPKKKSFEKVAPDLHTNDQLQACYRNSLFKVSAGPMTVKSIKNGGIK